MPAERPTFPVGKTRLSEVYNPETGHYKVVVRVDGLLPKTIPDYGTDIEDTGLAPQEYSGKYDGYVLTDVKPDETGSNHYYVFEKLPGYENIGQQQGVWGVEDTSVQLVSSHVIAPTHGIRDSKTEPVRAGLYQKQVVAYPDVPATLTEYRTDEETGLVIKMVKTLVDPASALPAASVQSLVERQAWDKWHSIQIVSSRATVDDLPASETYSSIARISLPNFLEAVGIYWEQDVDTGADADGVIGANAYPENKSWSLGATAKASAQVSGAGWVKIKNGYNGPANASVTRTYHNGPPTTTHTIHKFIPVTGQLIIHGQSRRKHGSRSKGGVGSEAYTQGSGSLAAWGRRVQYMMIPEVEHNNPAVSISGSASATSTANALAGSIPGGGTYPAASATAIATGSYRLILPASSVPKVSGNTYIHDVNVSKWRFGIWVKEVVTVTVP